MRKTFRTAAVVTMMAVMAGGSVFAKSKKSENPRRPDVQVPDAEHRDLRGPEKMHGLPGMDPKNTVIGKVKSVDEKNGTVTLSNADGKNVDFIVTPFTHIMIQKEGELPPKIEKAKSGEKPELPPKPALTDIKEGSWAMISSFEQDTTAKIAASVHVKTN